MSEENAKTRSDQLKELETELENKTAKLLRSEEEIIKLTKLCAELMNKDLKFAGDSDSWSLGSGGADVDVELWKERLAKCKQNEEYLNIQLEVLQSTIKIMIHPDDIESREKNFKLEISELSTQVEQLLAANMSMKMDLSQIDELKAESKKLWETDETKTSLIEELHEKLTKYGEQNKALVESLQETEQSEQTLRDSLTRIKSKEKFDDVDDDTQVKTAQFDQAKLLQRVDSLEEKDTRLRNRLQQAEEHEKAQENQLEGLKDELQLTKDINSSQEQAILDLQQQISELGLSSERKTSDAKTAELEKKCRNMKLLLSQKMEELEFSRKSITSLEKSVADLQATCKELAQLQNELKTVSEELTLAKDINASQEETIRLLQTQAHSNGGDFEGDLAHSYHQQLTNQLSADEIEEMQAEYQNETRQLKEEIDCLNKQFDARMEAHQQELTTSQAKITNLEKEMAKSASKLQIAQNLIDELKTQNKKLVRDSKVDYDEKLKDLNVKLQGEKVQNSVHRDVIVSMSPQIEKLKCENESLEGKLNSLNEKLNASEMDVAKKRSEFEALRTKSNLLEKKLEESKEVISSLQSSQTTRSELADVTQKLETKMVESDNLAVDLIELTDKCADMEKQLASANEALKFSLTERNGLQNVCGGLKSEINDLQEAKQRSEAQLVCSNDELSRTCQRLTDVEELRQVELKRVETLELSLKRECEKQEEREMEERHSIAELQALVVVAAKDLQHMESEKAVLITTLNDSRSKVIALQAENDEHLKKVHQVADSLSKHQAQISTLKEQVANLNSELNRADQTNSTMVASLKHQIYSLTQEKSALQSRNDKLVIEVDKILSEKQVYIDEIEKLASELKHQRSASADEISVEKQRVESLNEKLDAAKKKLKEQDELSTEKQVESESQLDERIKQMSMANHALEAELQSVKLELSKVSQNRDTIKQQVKNEKDSDLKTDYEKLCQEYEEQKLLMADVSLAADQACTANNSLKLRVSKEQAKNQALLDQVESTATELKELTQSIEEERNKNIFLANKQTEKHKSEIATLQEVLSDLRSERDELKRQTAVSKSSAEKLSELSDLNSRLESLTIQNSSLISSLDCLQNEQLEQLSSASAETCILQAQLDNMKELVEKANEDKRLLENLKSLSSELQAKLEEERKAHSATAGQLQVIKSEQLTFKERVEDLKEKHEHSQQRCEELTAEVKLLEQQLDDKSAETKILSQQLTKMETENQIFQSDAEKRAELVIELETFELLLAEKKTKCLELEDKNTVIQNQLSAHEGEVKEHSDRLLSSESELSALKSGHTEHGNLKGYKSQLSDQKAVCYLAKAAASLQFQCDTSDMLEEKTSGQDDYIDALQSEIKMLTNQLASTKKESDDLSAHVSELDEQLSSASSLGNQVEHLQKKFIESVASCDQLRDKLTAAHEESAELSAKQVVLTSENQLAQENVQSVSDTNLKLKAKNDQLVGEINLLRGELTKVQNSSGVGEVEDHTQDVSNSTDDELLRMEKQDSNEYGSEKSDTDLVDYKTECEALKEERTSLEARLQESLSLQTVMNSENATLNTEIGRLASEAKTEQQNSSDAERDRLENEIFELKQKLKTETRLKQNLEKAKEDFDERILCEKKAAEKSEKEVEKLQMSISLLMTSHETEMASLQAALTNADGKLRDLEEKVTGYSCRSDTLNNIVAKLTNELHSLKESKETVHRIMSDFMAQNTEDSIAFQQQFSALLQQIQTVNEDRAGNISPSLTAEQHIQNTLPMSSSPLPTLTSFMDSSFLKPDPVSAISHSDQLSKADLVAKLSDQTKHELILRKHLEEARQSLAFYRSAIDNIIDCLGTAMPSVKKWANDVLNYEDQAFNQQLDALISNESALQRRCHALEISEKALTESFLTKENEYQLAIHRLEDMVSIFKTSKATLLEELKQKSIGLNADAEQQVASLKQEIYELEGNVRKLTSQNEEIQFAYEQECERRQVEEEERCRVDQRSRLSTIETVRESEYLAKIASLETKISSLLSTQNELESKIESFKHNSEEEELKQRIATVERSERALLRKIEILQESDVRGNSAEYENSLDKPEDLLRQKIWEMERMEIHLKQQVSDLEHDREELHEIARSDKNTIHELNIQLAEAGLNIKNLKAQLARLEQAEETVCTKLETAESHILELEEKLKETLNNEKTMRLQLDDVELSEDSLRFHADTVERSLDSLQASETLLKSTIDDLTNERQQALKETASWKARFSDLEAEHTILKGQLVQTKNREITLKGKISELAAIEASLQTRIREVELQNETFKNEVLHLKKSATGIRDSLSDSLMCKDELTNMIQNMKSVDENMKCRIAELEADKFELEKRLQDINIKYAELQQTADAMGQSKVNERLATALANEKIARDNVVRLEAVLAAYESRQTSGVIERENFQLNAENKNMKEKLKTKERDSREVEEKVNRLTAAGNIGGGTYRISKLQGQVKDLQAQLRQSEQTRAKLEELLQKIGLSTSKSSCGHNTEISSMKAELSRLKAANDTSVHRYAQAHVNGDGMRIPNQPSLSARGFDTNSTGAEESVRTQCLKELVDKVNQRNALNNVEEVGNGEPVTSTPAGHLDVSDDEAAEIASQSSIWEKLEPPVRQSPRPVTSARLQPSSPPSAPVLSAHSVSPTPADTYESASDVPEESSLWENLELVAPRKSVTQPANKLEIVFGNEAIAPVYCKSVSQVDVKESADEASDLEELTVPTQASASNEAPSSNGAELEKQQSPTFSILAAQASDAKDVCRLKQTVTDLERRLKSRETELRMLRNGQKEIERESNLSGDLYTMKTKLKALQVQLDIDNKKIGQLREEIISRDKNITNRQVELVELRVELRRVRKELAAHTKEQDSSSAALSPNSRLHQIQMCTSPGRQTTVEQDASDLYKSMLESKSAHIEQLTEQLQQKTSEIARLENELGNQKTDAPSPLDSNSSKFKYLDDRYTEAATKCYKMKEERDEWKQKYDCLLEEHCKCAQQSTEKCLKCKQLKSEIKRLQKELRVYKDRLVGKTLGDRISRESLARSNVDELPSSTTDAVSSLSEDTFYEHNGRGLTSLHTDINGNASHSAGYPSTVVHAKPFEPRYYEAISDYNPRYFSTSGRSSQETPLKQGQIVKVLEQADENGYTRAEVDGRIYLVPLKYLQQRDRRRGSTIVSTTPHKHIRAITTHLPTTSARTEPMAESRRTRSSSPTKFSFPGVISSSTNGVSDHTSTRQLQRKPQAPTDLSADVVANEKLYVEWKYVQHLDHAMKSHGIFVTGFRVFLNGRATRDIDSAYTTVTSIDLKPHQLSDLHTVSVQALGAGNNNSPLVHVSLPPSNDNTVANSQRDRTIHGTNATKRLFMAYYDYDPTTQGSSSRGFRPTQECKLRLKTGDFIVVYGQARPNGFYFAEMDGKTGYVPEAFIRQVPAENAKRFGFYDNDVYLR